MFPSEFDLINYLRIGFSYFAHLGSIGAVTCAMRPNVSLRSLYPIDTITRMPNCHFFGRGLEVFRFVEC